MLDLLDFVQIIIPGSMITAISFWCVSVYIHAYKCYKGKI